MANFHGYPGRKLRFIKNIGFIKAGEVKEIEFANYPVVIFRNDPIAYSMPVIASSVDPNIENSLPEVEKGWFSWLK